MGETIRRRFARMVVILGGAFLACDGPLGSAGDECITPEHCELGLRCYAGRCTSAQLTCGEGTEPVSGECRAVRLSCGRGTVEEDGVCELEPPPDAGVDSGPEEPGPDGGVDGGAQ